MGDVHQLLGQGNVLLLHADTVTDDVDGDVGVHIAQRIQIHFHRRVDLDDVLLVHAGAADVLDDGYAAVQLVQMQILVDVHALAGPNMIQDHAVLNAVNIHNL